MPLVGITLLVLNGIGLVQGLRSPELPYERPDDLRLSEARFLAELEDLHDTDGPALLRNVTRLVNDGMAHAWDDDELDLYRIRLPWSENYLLRLAGYPLPRLFGRFEFRNWRRAIERGVGLCSQHAFVVAGILQERGYDARIVGLDGHVVAQAPLRPRVCGAGSPRVAAAEMNGDTPESALLDEVSGRYETAWLLDADYGVVLPFDLAAAEENPERVRPYYVARGLTPSVVDELVRIYGAEGNHLRRAGSVLSYRSKLRLVEDLAYALKWVIPVLLCLPLFWAPLVRRTGGRTRNNVLRPAANL